MTFPSQSIPFFRILLSFNSMLTINRYCYSLKILQLIRRHFSLVKNSLPIILHEITTDKEYILTNEINESILINHGIYLALIKYNEIKYQPLIDLRYIPIEILPEKKFLPKSMPFIIYDIHSFVKIFSNMIHSLSKNTSSSIQEIDIRNYLVTDSERIENNSLPFYFRILNENEQIFPLEIPDRLNNIDLFDNNQFSENDLIIFKQHLSLEFPLELKNCLHQLAIDKKLDIPEIRHILIKLHQQIIHNEFFDKDISKIIQNLQNASLNNQKQMSELNLSNLFQILLRIDQLERFNKLDKQLVQIFNERMHHLARMGILNYQSKLLKKLYQLDLNQQAFSQFIHNDLQRFIPKPIPLNSLGIKEILHQLHINISRLGLIPTLILIDNLQQLVQFGLLFILNKFPELKQYLILFIEHIQTGRFIGVYLQRLLEQMNNILQINIRKKSLITNQLNSLLKKPNLISKDKLINLAYQGRLNLITNSKNINEPTVIDEDNLQSLIIFLQSSQLSSQSISDFIQYLRHFAQLGILYHPQLCSILTILHKYKDQNNIPIEIFKKLFEQIKRIDYLSTYHHLNLTKFNQFLNEMINQNYLTPGQGYFILDRLVNLCQTEPITPYDIKILLINIKIEYNLQRDIYSKLLEYLDLLGESYSKSLRELHLFERELEELIFIKRIPDEMRKRLNEIMILCKKFRQYRILNFDDKFYNKIKEMFKIKNFFHKKQFLNTIIQIQKYFIQNSRNFLSDQQLDMILHNNKQIKSIEDMAKLGHLQGKSFVDYLTEHCLSNTSPESFSRIQRWPLTLDLNHPNVQHLIQLERQDQIDIGTLIEIQNQFSQLARFNKCSFPQIQILMNKILQYHSRKDFQLIQSDLNDLIRAIELEFFIQKFTSEHQISDNLNYHFREFLYRILQNEISIDELIRYRFQLKQFHHIKYTDIEKIKKFIHLLPKSLVPLTLTDRLLERLKWDGKKVEKLNREQLLKFERSGVLSQDTFEEIYNNLCRNTDTSSLSIENNQLFYNLFDKINDLLNDDLIDLQQSIRIKEELYLLEDMIDLIDISQIITIESRLFNSSNPDEFQSISQELNHFIYQQQFRLSKAQDLIFNWHLNEEKGNVYEKQIIKLLNELANLNHLYNNSTISILNRYISMKEINHRHLIKDLEHLKTCAVLDKQAIEYIRSIENRLYKIDSRKRLNELLIKDLENNLKQIFNTLSHSFEQKLRIDIYEKLNELLESYVKSTTNEYSSDQLLTTFHSYITQIKQGQTR